MPKKIPHKFKNGLEYKRCSKCTSYKLLKEFNRNSKNWDKKHNQCYSCRTEYRDKNKKKISLQQKKKYQKNKEKIKKYKQEYRKKPENKARRNKNNKERYKEDPQHRLLHSARCRLNQALKAQGIKKTKTTMTLCGCTLNTLKRHIEKQFTDGMSWNLRSSFHIDHIVPCAAFNLSDEIEQGACFWYVNLQPLPPSINISKNAKFKVEDKDRLIQDYIKSKKNMYNSDS